MRWRKILDAVFPHVEPLQPEEAAAGRQKLKDDLDAICAARWSHCEEVALEEARRIAAAEADRVKTAEGKATTFLVVLIALVPVIITLQAANWEKKSGPAPEGARLAVLAVATVYVAAAAFNAVRALQVSGFQRVGEGELVALWKSGQPVRRLVRATLLAARGSRDTVNWKVTRIKVTYQHLLRAVLAFVALLLLDPLFFALGYRNPPVPQPAASRTIVLDTSERIGGEGLCPTARMGSCDPLDGYRTQKPGRLRGRVHTVRAVGSAR